MTNSIVIAYAGDLGLPSGGSDRTLSFANHLSSNGYDVHIVCPIPTDKVSDGGFTLHKLETGYEGKSNEINRVFKTVKKSQRLATELDATIQFEHSILAGVGSFFNNDYIVDMHDLISTSPRYRGGFSGIVYSNILEYLEKRALKNAKEIITVSNSMEEYIEKTFELTIDSECIPNGCHIDDLPHYSESDSIEGRITFIGSFHSKVNYNVINKLAKLDEVKEFVIIGGGNNKDKLPLSRSNVRYLGWLPPEEAFNIATTGRVAIAPYISTPSLRVSSPVKIYSYAAVGLPMVLSEGPDLVDELDKHNAALTATDEEDFIEAVKFALTNEDCRKCMSQNARSISGKFSWDLRGERLVECLNKSE